MTKRKIDDSFDRKKFFSNGEKKTLDRLSFLKTGCFRSKSDPMPPIHLIPDEETISVADIFLHLLAINAAHSSGPHSTEVTYLLLTQQPWVRFSVFPKIFRGKIIDVAEVNQRRWKVDGGFKVWLNPI